MIAPNTEPTWLCKCGRGYKTYREAYYCCPHPSDLTCQFNCTKCGSPHRGPNRKTAQPAAEKCCTK